MISGEGGGGIRLCRTRGRSDRVRYVVRVDERWRERDGGSRTRKGWIARGRSPPCDRGVSPPVGRCMCARACAH